MVYVRDLGDVLIHGTLRLTSNTTLRVSGTFYLAPTGRIIGESPFDGRSLTILAAGPVILQGLVDLSGAPSDANLAGSGGRLDVRTRGRSPLQVPTIITQGGDVGSFVESEGSEVGKGGRGGDVTILGPPRGLIVLSGMKTLPTSAIGCEALVGTGDAGFRFPVNLIPRSNAVVENIWPWQPSGGVASDASCSGVPEWNAIHGLPRTGGRGIVTSGGMGGSAFAGRTDADPIVAGAPGGDGGHIDIGFPVGSPGVIRFRDVSLLTGAGLGDVNTSIPIAFIQTFEPSPANRMLQASGSAGGKGSTPGLNNTLRRDDLATRPLEFISKFGGDGGAGGTAGNITIDANASVIPEPTLTCSRSSNVYGHNLDNPYNGSAITEIGKRITLCRTLTDAAGATIFDSVSMVLATQGSAQSVCPGGCQNARVLGGSGGIPGGSFRNFELGADGATGSFGARGPMGSLVLPQVLRNAIPTP